MLIKYIKLSNSNLKYLILGLFSAIISSYNGVYVNHYTSLIIQGDFSNNSLYNLYFYSILTIIFTSIRGALFTYSQKNMNNHLKLLVYEKILNQPPSFYEITPVSELNDYIHHDTRLVADIISLNINVLIRSILNIIIIFYLIYEISYKLCILMIFLIIINIFISFIYDKLYKYYMNGHEEINKKLNNFIYETFSHISIQKTLAIENISKNKLIDYNNQISKYFIKETFLYTFNAFIHFNMPTSTMIIIILTAKYLNLTTNLITFILHFKSIFQTIKEIIEVHNEMSKCDKSYKKIINLLESPSIDKGSYIPMNFIPSIDFINISFKYQKSIYPILNNFCFSINPYDKIAIIGSSGEGKSTIAKLLLGLLKINKGSILINNINIDLYDNIWLKNKIGYVAQDTILFSDTIANNISYGLINKTNEDIEEASKLANADEFISKLPNKYQTNLEGTELSSLSGGQKQRISIARALIRKPEIIIFDEATSALDPYCEEIVQKTIKECFNKNNATMIVIAHRKSALEIVDRVYKLEKSQLLPFNNF
jgi:ABC-type multidrug transport system fused ATPase/permease subunit